MNIMRYIRIFFSFATLLLVGLLPAGITLADTLYVGDGGDNTIKSFDANSGAFLDTSDGPGISGLAGPRGIVVDAGTLLVINQNASLDIPGEVLRYDTTTGAFLGALIPSTDEHAPFAPDGIVLGSQNDLFVANVFRKSNSVPPPGRVNRYANDGAALGTFKLKNNEHHPRGVVVGPDGLLYISARDFKSGLGGTVLRYDADGNAKVFIDDKGGPGKLNRPDGLVFGPDGRLYVTSFQAGPGDTDSIRIYDADGKFVNKIDLHNGTTEPRVFAQSVLFGPNGKLFVPISNTGEVRRYNSPTTGDYDPFIPAGDALANPWFMSFGNTNPSTLSYEE